MYKTYAVFTQSLHSNMKYEKIVFRNSEVFHSAVFMVSMKTFKELIIYFYHVTINFRNAKFTLDGCF